MKAVLKFLNDMAKSEPHLSSHVAISKCRDNDALGFDEIPIDMSALHSHVDDIFSGDTHDASDSLYQAHEPENPNEADQAEYYKNSSPNFT
jgi:hypothetical protein